jgi:hypothetical protein
LYTFKFCTYKILSQQKNLSSQQKFSNQQKPKKFNPSSLLNSPNSRKSAQTCREKKKAYIETIEGRIATLESQNCTLINGMKRANAFVDRCLALHPELRALKEDHYKNWRNEEILEEQAPKRQQKRNGKARIAK